jgi:hypothetical protein
MSSLSIVASKDDYKIYDNDEQQTVVKGIASYKNALYIYERILELKDNLSYRLTSAPVPCTNSAML